jgi:tetraacyldisaccharide-1-P 4'-kinase
MARELNIKPCWFHKDHYDIPKKRIDEITDKCLLTTSKIIVEIINGATNLFKV